MIDANPWFDSSKPVVKPDWIWTVQFTGSMAGLVLKTGVIYIVTVLDYLFTFQKYKTDIPRTVDENGI